MHDALGQARFTVRTDWGVQGAHAIGPRADFIVIVDVLSFTTTVSVALDQGAEVFPYPRAMSQRARSPGGIGRSWR